MNRLTATLGCDLRLQWRNGFYYAAGFVALYSVLLVGWLDREDRIWVLPAFIFVNLLINTFYFLAGLVLLEKREGTLEAQVVTPLTTCDYLLSKLVTLTGLAVAENLAIAAVSYGLGFHLPLLIAGMVLGCAIYALFGFIAVARYDSINEFLFPSFVYTMLFVPPLVPYLGFSEHWVYHLHPMAAPLALMKAAFVPVAPWQLVSGTLYSIAWIGIAWLWSRQVFRRFIVEREGAR